jgi:hypothetical protein
VDRGQFVGLVTRAGSIVTVGGSSVKRPGESSEKIVLGSSGLYTARSSPSLRQKFIVLSV